MLELAERAYESDVLVVGSEGAGARAAIAAHDAGAKVIIVSKGRMAKSGATITAGADFDLDSKAAGELFGERLKEIGGSATPSPSDSPDIFLEDMLVEGKYINNQKILEVHVSEAPKRVKELVDWGMPILDLVHGSGHRYPRGLYSMGIHAMSAMAGQVRKRGVEVVEDTAIIDLVTSRGRCVGAIGLDLVAGAFVLFKSRAVVLATGGAHMIWPSNTGTRDLNGDGPAMAYRVGAELVDMEMVQFMPTVFVFPEAWRDSGFPLVFIHYGLHAWVLNRFGERFMWKWDPKRGEATTRDILSVGFMNEILEGRGSEHGGVYISLAHWPSNLISYIPVWFHSNFRGKPEDWIPTSEEGMSYKELMEKVIKDRQAIEVCPAVHFFMGGIRINEKCETHVRGLYAAGECAGGTHGANRLTGNACTQIIVQGKIAGEQAATYASRAEAPEVDRETLNRLKMKLVAPLERTQGIRPVDLRKRIQKIAHENVGPIRESSRLERAIAEIERMRNDEIHQIYVATKSLEYNKEWLEAIQLDNMLQFLEATTKSALMRTESRGAHYRRDYPNTDNDNWLRNIVVKNADGKMQLVTEPVVITRFTPPRGVRPYPGE